MATLRIGNRKFDPHQDVTYSRDLFTPKRLWELHGHKLPLLIRVEEGYYGGQEFDGYSAGDVLWVIKTTGQSRVVARDLTNGGTLSVPLDYPVQLQPLDHDGKGDISSLEDIMKGYKLPLTVEIHTNSPLRFFVAADQEKEMNFRKLRLVEQYEERYFLVHTVLPGQMLLGAPCVIPFYLPLGVQLGLGPSGNVTTKSWDKFMIMLKSLDMKDVTDYKDHPVNKDLMVFNDEDVQKSDGIYDYISPYLYVSCKKSTFPKKNSPPIAGQENRQKMNPAHSPREETNISDNVPAPAIPPRSGTAHDASVQSKGTKDQPVNPVKGRRKLPLPPTEGKSDGSDNVPTPEALVRSTSTHDASVQSKGTKNQPVKPKGKRRKIPLPPTETKLEESGDLKSNHHANSGNYIPNALAQRKLPTPPPDRKADSPTYNASGSNTYVGNSLDGRLAHRKPPTPPPENVPEEERQKSDCGSYAGSSLVSGLCLLHVPPMVGANDKDGPDMVYDSQKRDAGPDDVDDTPSTSPTQRKSTAVVNPIVNELKKRMKKREDDLFAKVDRERDESEPYEEVTELPEHVKRMFAKTENPGSIEKSTTTVNQSERKELPNTMQPSQSPKTSLEGPGRKSQPKKEPPMIKQKPALHQTPGSISLKKSDIKICSIADVPPDVSSLSVHQVAQCLRLLNLGEYADKFCEYQIDGALLVKLDERNLKEEFGMSVLKAKKLCSFSRDNWRPLK